MREILFRGKRKDNGKWVQGFLWKKKYNTDKLFISCFPDEDDNEEVFVIYPETVGQYTGLTDKNGTKVFEGDIIKVEYAGNNRGIEGTVAKVVFEKCKFALVWGWHNEIVCLTDFCNVTFEVISNIHDNPELLESEVAE